MQDLRLRVPGHYKCAVFSVCFTAMRFELKTVTLVPAKSILVPVVVPNFHELSPKRDCFDVIVLTIFKV